MNASLLLVTTNSPIAVGPLTTILAFAFQIIISSLRRSIKILLNSQVMGPHIMWWIITLVPYLVRGPLEGGFAGAGCCVLVAPGAVPDGLFGSTFFSWVWT